MADLANIGSCGATVWLLYLFWELKYASSSNLSSSEVDQHLEIGMRLLGQGQLQEALSHFHSAIDADSSNYLSYFRRATVYLAMGRAKQALPDLQQVLKMKPDFLMARVQRGTVHLKMGSLDEAHIDFEEVLRRDPHHEEAMRMYSVVERVREDLRQAETSFQYGDTSTELALVSSVLEACPWSVKLRERRAELHLQLDDTISAVSDLRSAAKLQPDSRALLLRIALLLYSRGDVHESLNSIRECLKLDQDDKDCHKHYTKVKKIVKVYDKATASFDEKDYDTCIANGNRILEFEKSESAVRFRGLERVCTCQSVLGTSAAIDSCSQALAIEPDARLYCERADAYLNDDMFDEAIRDYQQALEIDENFRRAKDGVSRAQKLRKQRGQRDYYKILGVKKNADKREITKAYRTLARKWHPDNYVSESDEVKKKAEKKFIDIAAAKEVLTDPEMRKKFDDGVDPLDPESEAGRGFNPFQHGFHGFPGGGQTFTFHFN